MRGCKISFECFYAPKPWRTIIPGQDVIPTTTWYWIASATAGKCVRPRSAVIVSFLSVAGFELSFVAMLRSPQKLFLITQSVFQDQIVAVWCENLTNDKKTEPEVNFVNKPNPIKGRQPPKTPSPNAQNSNAHAGSLNWSRCPWQLAKRFSWNRLTSFLAQAVVQSIFTKRSNPGSVQLYLALHHWKEKSMLERSRWSGME